MVGSFPLFASESLQQPLCHSLSHPLWPCELPARKTDYNLGQKREKQLGENLLALIL